MKSDEMSFFLQGTNGQGVLLVHGLTGAPAEMKLIARLLHRRGFSVCAPLLAGHGKDVHSLRRSSWQDWLDSVEEAAIGFSSKVGSMFAAGICVGGKLSMLAADKRPDLIKAVAIYSPCFRYDGWDVPFYYPLLSSQIGWLSLIPFLDRISFSETSSLGIKDQRMRRMIEGMQGEGILDKFPGKGLVEMYKLGNALKRRLPEIYTPTLILHAEEDDLSGAKHARYISDHIGGPRELKWIRDSYHMIHVDRQHRLVADLTAQFFEEDHASAAA